MTCYKLVTIEFKWMGLQTRMERFLHRQERRIFLNFHRQLFTWMDDWAAKTLEELRAWEEEIRGRLDEARATGEIVGMQVDGDGGDSNQEEQV
jgi:hypothetical protein